jgi:hypothetical protein
MARTLRESSLFSYKNDQKTQKINSQKTPDTGAIHPA